MYRIAHPRRSVGEVAQASEGEPPRLWGHLEAGEELQLTGGIPRLIRVEIFGVHPIESLGGSTTELAIARGYLRFCVVCFLK
jgi:hypothetical protein